MITDIQRTARADKIGSSDAAAILGFDPYRSASDVWLEKTGQAEGFDGNEHTDRGNLLEPVLIEYAMKELDWKLARRDQMFVHSSEMLVANLDACDVDSTAIIEAKTASNPDEWGADGSDEVPERVIVQVHHQFVCVPTARVCWVPVLLAGYRAFDFRLYRIQRNDDLAAHVAKSGIDFMEQFVRPGIQPTNYCPSIEVLKRVRRQPNKIVPVAAELVERLIAAKAKKKTADDECKKSEAYLLAAMGDAEGADYGGGLVTYLETHRKAYSVEATSYRQIRFKNKPAGEIIDASYSVDGVPVS